MSTYCIHQGTLPSALWPPKCERNPKKRGYIHTYIHTYVQLIHSAVCNRNQHDVVKQLYSNKN